MSSLDETLREERLRKIIKSLNKVSEIDSREIRKDAKKSRSTNNKMKINYQRQIDKLLGKQEGNNLPNLLKANKIFDKRSNKIESIKEKQIESQASLKLVDFQFRKLKLKKEKIARKHHLSHTRYQSSPKLEKVVIDPDQIKNNHISEIFEKGTLKSPTYREQIQEAIIKRLQTTVKSSRKYIQTVYQDPEQLHSIIANNTKDNLELSGVIPNEFTFLTEQSQSIEKLPEPSFTKTQSIIIPPDTTKTKRKSLIDLIRMSESRQKSRGERIDERMTLKETQQYKSVKQTIQSLRKHIQQDNKLKESVVFSGLKKILYGDRKGRFIQDNTFKTRLKGECSDHYMNILKEQEQILKNFNGSYFSRRNLAEKFADILGKIHKTQRPYREELFQ